MEGQLKVYKIRKDAEKVEKEYFFPPQILAPKIIS